MSSDFELDDNSNIAVIGGRSIRDIVQYLCVEDGKDD